MNRCVHSGQWARMLIGLVLFCSYSAHSAAENIWKSTFGQGWFWESGASSGEQLAGTWWESSLSPGNTYEIKFEVTALDGAAGLLVGERNLPIDRTGWHSYEFDVREGSKRRIMFVAQRHNTTVGVRGITVQTTSGTTSASSSDGGGGGGGGGGGHWMPKGHYLTFDRERNLKQQVLVVMDNPRNAKSNWHLGIARDLDEAFKTPGVKGFGMNIDWRTLETWDGGYDWTLLDANMEVARRYGLKFFVQVATRSFNGQNIMPHYFPGQYVLRSNGGFVAKRWDPWVYTRLIRLYKAIARRYANDSAFGGIGSSETALGSASNSGDYSYWKYRNALIKIATETQAALTRGRFFMYLNFVERGQNLDMRKDGRVDVVKNVPSHALAVGGPDITPDERGMQGSVNSYRIHLRKTKPHVEQFCAAQNVDQGIGGINKKTNKWRHEFIEMAKRRRNMEKQWWFNGQPAIIEFDDVHLHPQWKLGVLWHPRELLDFADRNFHCDYFFWNYRENVHNLSSQFWWEDIRPVIVNNQNFFK